jgi:hypothetical protein
MPTKLTKQTHYEWLCDAIKEPTDECILWPFNLTHNGYGTVNEPTGNGRGNNVRAHRLAYKLVHGRWPEPCGLHRCDVRRCINPRHIYEGSNAANMTDMIAKGRAVHHVGERASGAKLAEADILAIRSETGLGYRRLAKKYGVDRTTIKRIVRRMNWKHI